MPEFDFEKLSVYQKAVSFADGIYRITQAFPKQEQFGMTSQLRRAAVSISLNIAEGVGRDFHGERKRFYLIARGSIYECVALLTLAGNQEFLPAKTRMDLVANCRELTKMLNGLIRALR